MLYDLEEKIALFKNLIEKDGLSDAYLFFGQKGAGKKTFARGIANFLEYNIFDAENRPLFDTTYIEGEKGIGIDEIRDVKRFLGKTPLRSTKRLVIIDNAEKLTPQAVPAMLKITEEPPPCGLIIFIAKHPDSLSEALRSRLIKIYFKSSSKKQIESCLLAEGASEKKAAEIAKKSFGSIGRALNLLNPPPIEKNEEPTLAESI